MSINPNGQWLPSEDDSQNCEFGRVGATSSLYTDSAVPKVVKVYSIQRYIDEVVTLLNHTRTAIHSGVFRGHSDVNYSLEPAAFRDTHASLRDGWDSSIKLGKQLLEKFKSEVFPFLHYHPKNDLEWMALAQHYGLPTNLLDWTTNPLVALYFAVEEIEKHNIDGCVWHCMLSQAERTPETSLISDGIITFRHHTQYVPPRFDSRITNQNAVLSICLPEKYRASRSSSISTLKNVIQFIIPSTKKKAMLRSLSYLGINKSFIYPGIEGVAKNLLYQLNHTTEIFNSGSGGYIIGPKR